MKTIAQLTLVLALMLSVSCSFEDEYRTITAEELPANAQTFIKTNFPEVQISHALQESGLFENDYKVFLANGAKIEFDEEGNWEDIECKTSKVPLSAMPVKIQQFLTEKHPNLDVVKIDRDNNDYDLELRTGLEIQFNLSGDFMRYDD